MGYRPWDHRVEQNLATEHASKDAVSVHADQDEDT